MDVSPQEQQKQTLIKPTDDKVNPLIHGAAAIMGGSISTAVFYPLDFLRTRMHTYKGGNTFPLRSARQIIREEGFKGVYRGIIVSLIAHSLGWGIYMVTFRTAQQKIFIPLEENNSNIKIEKNNLNASGTPTCDFLSACFAAIVTGTIVTPFNLLKTRRQLYDVRHNRKPRGFFMGLKGIIGKEGATTLLRGVGPQILLTGSTTIQVTLYEEIKRQFFSNRDNPTTTEVVIASALSKAIASTICNPLEVVRTRMQDKKNQAQNEYRSMGAGLQTIWRTEGILGLYRGLPVNICRVIPTTVMAFVLYEKCLLAFTLLSSMKKTPLVHDHLGLGGDPYA